MKILVTGAGGQLGYDIVRLLGENCDDEVRGVSSADFDLTVKPAVTEFMHKFRPDAVIHCAAYTAVDKAEDDKERCLSVNALGTEYLADAVRETGGKMLYVSTDYVFHGDGDTPHETGDATEPINVYGLSKLHGEQAVKRLLERYFIVRTSWVFGTNGGNFVKTMLRLGGMGNELRVVDDQIGSPTYTVDLAQFIARVIATAKYGVYHATNSGYCSWYDFTREIFRQAGLDVPVTPVTSEEYPTRAKRPRNSRLSHKSLIDNGFVKLPGWQDALKRFLVEVDNR